MLLKPAFLDRVHHWDESMLLRVSATVLRRSVLVTAAQWQSRTADGWGYLLVPVMLIWFDYPGGQSIFRPAAAGFRRREAGLLAGKKQFSASPAGEHCARLLQSHYPR